VDGWRRSVAVPIDETFFQTFWSSGTDIIAAPYIPQDWRGKADTW